MAKFTRVSWGGKTGIKTDFGALLVSPSGDWTLYDAANKTLVSSLQPPQLNMQQNGTIALHVSGTGVQGGAQPCLGNGMVRPCGDSKRGIFMRY